MACVFVDESLGTFVQKNSGWRERFVLFISRRAIWGLYCTELA